MSKPVIFIPGYPGSHLRTRDGRRIFLSILDLIPTPNKEVLKMLEGPDDLKDDDRIEAGPPIRRLARIVLLDLAKQAESLYQILGRIHVDPSKFGYDWRRPIWDEGTQERLAAEVRGLVEKTGERVIAIAHSTGGLVLRHLLENNPEAAQMVERVIAFGVPWAGLLKTLRFLDGEERFVTLGRQRAQTLIASSWAAFDLMPPDPGKTEMTGIDGSPLNLIVDETGHQTSPLVQQGWFRPDLAAKMKLRADKADEVLGSRHPSLQNGGTGVDVINVVGWGADTFVQATISGSGDQQTVGHWQAESDPGVLDGGDGTVPFCSASWLRGQNVTRYHVPVGFHHGARKFPHSSLWRNPGGRNLLRHLLGGKRFQPFVYAAVDEDHFRDPFRARVRVRFSTLDQAGAPLTGVHVDATDLTRGSAVGQQFETGDGRHVLTVPRVRMRRVHGHRFRRFTLRITWDGGSLNRHLLVNQQGG